MAVTVTKIAMTTTPKIAVIKGQGASGPKEQPGSSASFNLVEYLKGVRQEWFKVTWPSRSQVVAETGVVLMVVAFFAIFVFLVDKIFQFGIGLITKI